MRILGRCLNNTENKNVQKWDWAYRFNENQISLSSGDLFPTGFPSDFSILIVVRVKPGDTYPLITVYNEDGDEQIAISLGNDIVFNYKNHEFINFNLSIDDGE